MNLGILFLPMTKTQLTRSGFDKLKQELVELNTIKKPKAVERLSRARSMGDLSENSEYSAAKEELAFVDGRVQEIEEILKTAEVVEDQQNSNTVNIGSKVTVSIVNTNDQDSFYIVGEYEADPMNKKLSNTSPIGQALFGKTIGDIVEVDIPAGKVQYKIIDIK